MIGVKGLVVKFVAFQIIAAIRREIPIVPQKFIQIGEIRQAPAIKDSASFAV